MSVLLLTGCGGGSGPGEDDAKPTAGISSVSTAAVPEAPVSSGAFTPSGPSEPSEPEAGDASARTEVLEVYGLMWAEKVKAYRAGSVEGTDLKRHMTPEALGVLEADLARMNKERTVMRGDLGHEPEVSAIAAGAEPPTATVQDCVDGAKWQTLDTTTGWRIPPPAGQPLRHAATTRMELTEGGRWTVTEYTADRNRACQRDLPGRE
ncbi:secreted protein/lipoprotein [Streptomyces pratensis]|uniref:secreted protein/lipoprotein n=1 Tax=Streptomyces pratensis TaxID=1169025 RepID=UPI00362BBA21